MVTKAAGAGDELPYPVAHVKLPCRVLRRKTLVGVNMSGEDNVRTKVVERLPNWLHESVTAARAEAWLMPVGEHVARLVRR
jgi:hypothetical protein